MRRRTGLTLVTLISGALAVLAIGSYATADSGKKNVSTGPMSGYLEGAPGGPVSSVATGSFEATIDDDASEIDFTLTFADLEAPVLFAHIHFGQRSVNGGVAAFLCGGGGKPACPQSGTVTGTIVPADIVGPAGQGIAAGEFGELVAAIRAGRTYANVHSTKFPAGEVRGQINDDNQRDD
ncbi:MAG TPA: CHRD domain-containing protein [Gaiellaceae bacterium]|nr:CHRD domain-containing protein [Gaiellaceae bacterium]